MGEVVTVFLGQAGTQIANACWELFCLEHGIRPDGYLHKGYRPADETYKTFFSAAAGSKLTPRTVIIDLEPTVIDEIRTGSYQKLFNPSWLISGKEDAANNFAKGYCSLGPEAIDLVMDRINEICEECSLLSGFVIFRSRGGGTGGGLATLLLEQLYDSFPKRPKLDFSIFPAPNISTAIVEPYNAVLTTHGSLDYETCCFLIDNEALYDICAKKLNVLCPTYTNLNRLEAQVVSSVTASLRFEGALNVSLDEFQTNLVPYPRIHFPILTYAPITIPERAINMEMSVRQITSECFDRGNQMVKCDPRTGAYTSCCLLYRGDVSPSDVNRAIVSLKGKDSIRFVDWSPTSFKVGVNYQPATTVPGGDLARCPRTVAMISNNTAIRHAWTRLTRNFDLMYQKKAFLHHYIEAGLDETVFEDARDNMAAIIEDYKEVEFE